MSGPNYDLLDFGRGVLVMLERLARIADAYDANELDDEARKWWGPDENPTFSESDPRSIQLYAGRGGRELLTLEDCMAARRTLDQSGGRRRARELYDGAS